MLTAERTLTTADLRPAAELLARAVDEIPLYRWVLGEHIADPTLCEWLAEILVRPHLEAGYVIGSHQDGRLVGILVWHPHDADLSPDGSPPLVPADFLRASTIPGLRERLIDFLTSAQLPSPAADAVDVRLAAVLPECRGGDALTGMMREVERFCVSAARPYYAWTGSKRLRDWFVHEWGASLFATESRNGLDLYGVVSERPPRLREVRAGEHHRDSVTQ
ncbi:hypothetical protein CYJ73_02105 [Gordonia terrae]|uniref:GNAT family N-acetyltransferase n=1 Tax=Gordonia terrae TaxID=2055 RepID=A0A2I1REF6_9ACTN|nr:hypothetical protein [Gordonia terrae]PKZ67485.1 hypothetical protein CYJ73_02105 [Gordonia terrae]UPW11463.1 hypothetical protein M1C59_11905 [Gordonia terrae]